jgi:CHAT domain-containing protein/Tfp pilus assembly protein PilF
VFFSTWFYISPGNNPAVSLKNTQSSFLKPFYEATSFRSLGEYEKAIQSLLKAHAISRLKGPPFAEAKCLLWLGILEWDLGNVEQSTIYFDRALCKYNNVGDKCAVQYCLKCRELIRLYTIGKMNRTEKLNMLSILKFKEAINLSREIGFLGFEIKCLRQIGLSYWQINELDVFLKCNMRGLELAIRIGQIIEQGRFLNNIGVYYQKQKDFSRALAFFENALTALSGGANSASEAECLSNIGITFREMGKIPEALSYLSRALEVDEKHGGSISIALDLVNLGSVYLSRGLDKQNKGDLLQALEIFNRCRGLLSKDKGDQGILIATLNNVGIIQSELKDYKRARDSFNAALIMLGNNDNELNRCQIINNIAASHYYEGNIDEAINQYCRVLDISTRDSLRIAIMESCLGLGKCYEKKGIPSRALHYYYRSIEAKESLEGNISSEVHKNGVARNRTEAYQRAIEILALRYNAKSSINELEEIFRLIESMKARTFVESVIDARVNEIEEDGILLKNGKGTFQSIYLDTNRALKRIKGPAADHASSNKIDTEVCDIPQVQNKIVDMQTAFLEYFIGETNSYLILILNNKAMLCRLPCRQELEKSIRPYIKLISNSNINNNKGLIAAERIGGELIPLEKELEKRKIKSLVISPDGILHYVPFEALRISINQDSKYLIENMKVSYCPSASSLLALMQSRNINKRHKEKELLALGGPNYESQIASGSNGVPSERERSNLVGYKQSYGFSPLPFSENEVLEISKYFPKDKRDILVGDRANERALKEMSLEKYRIIHFACHGLLNEKYPFQSALVLSLGGKQLEDGLLQVHEICDLKMSADLIVLSACQTGYGRLEKLEGLIGLARPFFYAGARSVLASLWPINDKTTGLFMREFYRNLVEGLSIDRALQLAKIRMLESEWAHPFFWAGFILSGDSTALCLN